MKIYIPAEHADKIAFDNGYGLPVLYFRQRVAETGDTIILTFGDRNDPKRSLMTITANEIQYKGEYLVGDRML